MAKKRLGKTMHSRGFGARPGRKGIKGLDDLIASCSLSDGAIADLMKIQQPKVSARRKAMGLPPLYSMPLPLEKELVDRVLQLKREEKLTPQQIFKRMEKEGNKISQISVYRVLARESTKASEAQIARVSAATAIENAQLKVALSNFQSLSLAKKLQRLGQVNEAILELKKAIQTDSAKPEQLQSQSKKTIESAIAKLKRYQYLLNLFCRYVPKAKLEKLELDSKEQ